MIKKRATFFDNDIKLNKGYMQNKGGYEENPTLKKILPEVEILSEYEELHPGITAQLVKMIEDMKIDKLNTELAKERAAARLRMAGMISSLLMLLAMLGAGMRAVSQNQQLLGIALISIFSIITILSNIGHIKSLSSLLAKLSSGKNKKTKQKNNFYKNTRPKKAKKAANKNNPRPARIMIQKNK